MKWLDRFRRPEQKAEVSTLRTVNVRGDRKPPPLALLEETAPDDAVIPLVVAQIDRGREAHARRILDDAFVDPSTVIGPAVCRHCGEDLVVVCPKGHGGADEVLRDLTQPKAVPAPVAAEPRVKKSKVVTPHVCEGCGFVFPPRKGRYPAKCASCNAKKVLAA